MFYRQSKWGTQGVLASLVPLGLLSLWELAVGYGWWPRTLIAAPSEVVVNFLRLLMSGELLVHITVSLQRLLAGFVLGSGVAIVLGVVVGFSRLAERMLSPTVQVLAPIPVVAWIPLLIILLGIGETSKIVLVALGTFFLIFFSTVQGIRSTDRKLVEVAYIYQKTPLQLAWHVLLPSALPHILTALRAALGLSWILLIVAEVIASASGLGFLIWDARNFSRPDDMIVGMLTVGLLGKWSDQLLAGLQGRLLQWRQSFQGQ